MCLDRQHASRPRSHLHNISLLVVLVVVSISRDELDISKTCSERFAYRATQVTVVTPPKGHSPGTQATRTLPLVTGCERVGSASRKPISYKICSSFGFSFGSTLGTHLTPVAQLQVVRLFFRSITPPVDLLKRSVRFSLCVSFSPTSWGHPATNRMKLSASARRAMCSAEVQ
jgi:hypothetical protein